LLTHLEFFMETINRKKPKGGTGYTLDRLSHEVWEFVKEVIPL